MFDDDCLVHADPRQRSTVNDVANIEMDTWNAPPSRSLPRPSQGIIWRRRWKGLLWILTVTCFHILIIVSEHVMHGHGILLTVLYIICFAQVAIVIQCVIYKTGFVSLVSCSRLEWNFFWPKSYMLSFGNANVGDLYVNRRFFGGKRYFIRKSEALGKWGYYM